MTTTFAQLGLPNPLVRALVKRGITEPFPIQSAAIPDALAGRDISGKAPTGSGKTLAFGLPVLATAGKAARFRPAALVLAPTRELAEQIRTELAPLGASVDRSVAAVYGGVSYGPQKSALRRGADLLVATPGRLEDLLAQRAADLGAVELVVIDEADRMADMGFLPAVKRILDQTTRRRQTLLFSATLDGDVAALSRTYQHNPVRHEAASVTPQAQDATHHFWLVDHEERVATTADLVTATGRPIVFTRTRRGADRVAKQLSKRGVEAVALHGGRTQSQRDRALRAFSSGRARALVATDVAARGIHVDGVDAVIHFDPAGDHKDYVHRSGRTARAGASGMVISLVTPAQRRAVVGMQRALGLHAPIEAPRFETLETGGHRLGSSGGSEREPRPRREKARRNGGNPGQKAGQSATQGATQSVYVANLPWSTTADDLVSLFTHYGEVHQATVISNRRTGRSKGFGFVDMPRPAASHAIDQLHGSDLGGRSLTVRLAAPSRHHS